MQVSTSRKEPMDVAKVPLGRSLLFCLGIVVVYAIVAATRMKNGFKRYEGASLRNHVPSAGDSKQGGQSAPTGTITAQRSTIDQPFLIDAGIIQVVLVITAAAFTIRAFAVTADRQAVLIFGAAVFFSRIRVDELANWVFIASGAVSTLLYGIYLWEWTDRNLKLPSARGARVWLPVFALLVHLTFLFLLTAMLVLQILVRNVIPS
jgi:hypothetical protein